MKKLLSIAAIMFVGASLAIAQQAPTKEAKPAVSKGKKSCCSSTAKKDGACSDKAKATTTSTNSTEKKACCKGKSEAECKTEQAKCSSSAEKKGSCCKGHAAESGEKKTGTAQ